MVFKVVFLVKHRSSIMMFESLFSLNSIIAGTTSLGFQSSFSKTWYLEKVPWRVFYDRSLLGRCFLGFVLPVLEYCSAVWCSAADTRLKRIKLQDRVVSGARFLTGCVFECNIVHRRSVAVLCVLCKIRCNPMHPLYGTLPVPYVPVRVTHSAPAGHKYTYSPSRCRTSQYRMTFIRLWNDLVGLYSMVWDWRVSRAGPMLIYWHKLLYPL